MFFRYFYVYFNKFINHEKVVNFFNLYDFENIFLEKNAFKNLNFFKKIKISLLPRYESIDYSILNKTSLDVLIFRKKFFKNLNTKLGDYVDFQYETFSSSEDFKNFFDFVYERFGSSKKIDLLSLYAMFYFFNKHFSRFFSFLFFKKFENFNLIKFYFVLIYFFYFNSVKLKLSFFNLKKFSNWFLFSTKFKTNTFNNTIVDILPKLFLKDALPNKDTLITSLSIKRNYLKFYKSTCYSFFDRKMVESIKFFRFIRVNLNKIVSIKINPDFLKNIGCYFSVRFNESSTNKHINLTKLDNFIFFFLRKNKIFNKGRYSRNRQTYRTGFYWCLWLNIFVVYGLHFIFYRFIFTFGYLWIFLFIFFSSFVFSRALKYNYVSINFVVGEVSRFFKFTLLFFKNLYSFFENYFFKKINYDFIRFSKKEEIFFLENVYFKGDSIDGSETPWWVLFDEEEVVSFKKN